MSTHELLGDLIIRCGLADASGIARARELQMAKGITLGRALAELGIAGEAAVAAEVASATHCELFDGDADSIAIDVGRLLPGEFCRKRHAAPLGLEGNRLRLAVVDPLDYPLVDDVQFRTGKSTIAVVVAETTLERIMDRLYPETDPQQAYERVPEVNPAGEVESTGESEYDLVDSATLEQDTQLPPIVRLVNVILSDAATAGASDVHIEPHESVVLVRQRVDGILREVRSIAPYLRNQTISRIKVISGMDIAERRKPQDGRCRLRFDGKRIDLRVSTLPTQFGEKVVIRLLNPEAEVLSIERLGFTARNLQVMRSLLSRPQGMILLTGPTGSGKTSTLYAGLKFVKSPSNNIVTLEDPIEFQVPGVNQMQINARAGVTFAAGLRSVLRQDPNVILVGEIRDQETAEIALQAAQTGHLLLSTVHANDATATLSRLFDLGVQPFLVASSLVGIVAQRLVRRPCPACVTPCEPTPETVVRLGGHSQLPADGQWVKGQGCAQCRQSGFAGRAAIHEVLHVTDELRALISSRASEQTIRQVARRNGMRTLLEDAVEKAAAGLTTLDEVLRVVPMSEPLETAPHSRATSVPHAEAPAAPGSHAPQTRRRILIVEDSPTIVSVVQYFLELEGFEVLVAEDGHRGLELALLERPDVIVSDVQMPGMDGLTMVRALRRDERTRDVRVLMLTSEAGVDSETEGLAAGADDYILKPVEPRRLAARVRALLGRSQAA
jgi:type IV pilus assembly protein PilB